jgi:DNA adenine methylase Dam
LIKIILIKIKETIIIEFKKENLIKSPLNYVGGKYKLLPQILPLFPDKIDTFIDLFCGGCNVGINVNANKIICNDIEAHVIDLLNSLNQLSSKEALHILKNTINTYKLSKINEEGFKKIRKDYNCGKTTWNIFYAMITNAFNYQIRFNKNGEYNMPFGRNRSSFNPTLEKRFVKFGNKLKDINIKFTNNNYKTLDINKLNKNDFIYCDPPYLISCASYNENNGWNEEKDNLLLHILDKINKNNVKFALSNVLESKGKSNDILKDWSKKYNIYHLNNTYSNCNYHTKNKSKNSSDEVLITNY